MTQDDKIREALDAKASVKPEGMKVKRLKEEPAPEPKKAKGEAKPAKKETKESASEPARDAKEPVKVAGVKRPKASEAAADAALRPVRKLDRGAPPQVAVASQEAVTLSPKEDKEQRKAEKEAAARKARHERHASKHAAEDERPILEIPELPAHQKLIESISVADDYAAIRILYDEDRAAHVYDVQEPRLDDDERRILAFLRDTLVRTLAGRHGVEPDTWSDYLRDRALDAIVDHDVRLTGNSRERVLYHLIRDFIGFGPVDVMMADSQIEDISCDGPEIPIYVFHRKYESLRSTVTFEDDQQLDAFVIRLAQRSGKHISVADPLLDATLPDGSRLQATLSREVTTRGSSFTVRKFRADPLTPIDLMRYGTFTPEMAAYFWFVIEGGSSLMYAGGTASGKTTSLNAILQFLPPEKKVVSIEDTREINIAHENWIAGLTRSAFGGQDAGEVSMYDLLAAALRQRPEYLIVGEVRGREAQTLFQAMATGHAAYGTMHADSVASAVHRLSHAPIEVPRIMIPILDVLAIQVQARIDGRMVRRVKDVTELVDLDPDTQDILTNRVFEWDTQTDQYHYTGSSHVLERIREIRRWTEAELEAEFNRRIQLLEKLRDGDSSDLETFAHAVVTYYRRPEEVLAQYEVA